MLSELSNQGVRDRVLLLRSLPAFAPLEDHSLTLLAEHMRVRACKAGEVLLTLGEPMHNVYVVLEGEVHWQRADGASGDAQRRDVVGWLALMARVADGTQAVAAREAVVLELPAEALEHAMEDDFGIVRNSMRLGASALLASRDNLPSPDPPPPFEMGILRPESRTLVERLIGMRRGPLFERANAEALIALARSSRELRVEPGSTLWRIGDSATSWLLIEYGRVRCTNGAGKTQEVGANTVIGIMDSLAQIPRGYDAVTDTLLVGNRIDLESFLGVMETHIELARDFLALLARNVMALQAPKTGIT